MEVGECSGSKEPEAELEELRAASALIVDAAPPNGFWPPHANAAIGDCLDFLGVHFGFQRDNVRNQREHVVFLLANSQSRFSTPSSNSTPKITDVEKLKLRFQSLPGAFNTYLVPSNNPRTKGFSLSKSFAKITADQKSETEKFSRLWNEIICAFREEDLISNREMDLLVVPYPIDPTLNIIQWPLFLITGKIYAAMKNVLSILFDEAESQERDSEIWRLICRDECTKCAVIEFYELALLALMVTENEKRIFTIFIDEIERNISENTLLANIKGITLFALAFKFKELLEILLKRLYLLLEENASNEVPKNVEVCRRITFLMNSLFMKLPQPPVVRQMLSFSVWTPYHNEETMYAGNEVDMKNEDGVSILFYLQKIYPDEWTNCKERLQVERNEELWNNKNHIEEFCHWASLGGQTLYRTVGGIMYYPGALKLQASFEMASEIGIQEVTDMKFTYVIACQNYGSHKRDGDHRASDILNMMVKNPSLRVAYIDEVLKGEGRHVEKVYYSVLVKGVGNVEQEIFRIKLPGPLTIEEGKPENQNHGIIYTRGEALQAIDMN